MIGGEETGSGLGAARTGVARLRRLRGEGAFLAALDGRGRGVSSIAGGGVCFDVKAVSVVTTTSPNRTYKPNTISTPISRTTTVAASAETVR